MPAPEQPPAEPGAPPRGTASAPSVAPAVAGALVRASHPGPTVAVTAFTLAFGVLGTDLGPGRLLLLVLVVLTGQLTIGWTNDWADAARDAEAGRTDKPVARGEVARRTVGAAALAAGGTTLVLSLLLGWLPGLLHLLVVASGVAYDLGLKGTPASPLPYLVAFGALPAVATLAQEGPGWPPAAVMVAAGLLGVAAHFVNTVPDAEDDARTGVRGLPQRVGPRGSALLAVLVLALAAAVLLPGAVAAGGVRAVVSTMLLGTGVLMASLAGAQVLVTGWAGGPGPRHDRRAVGRSAFWLVVAAAGLVVAGFLAS